MNNEICPAAEDEILPLSGAEVIRCCVSVSFTLEFHRVVYSPPSDDVLHPQRVIEDYAAWLHISGPFSLEMGDRELRLDPANRMGLAEALDLWRREVDHAIGRADGSLEMVFTDGTRLAVPLAHGYEAWEFGDKQGRRVISLPAGRLAVWDARE